MLLGILGSDAFRDRLLMQAGFEEITNESDRQKVLAEYQKFVAAMANADHSSQEQLDRAVMEADNSFSALQVELAALADTHQKALVKYKDTNEEVVWLRSEREKALIETKSLKGLQKEMAVESSAVKASLESEILKLEEENETLLGEVDSLKKAAKATLPKKSINECITRPFQTPTSPAWRPPQ